MAGPSNIEKWKPDAAMDGSFSKDQNVRSFLLKSNVLNFRVYHFVRISLTLAQNSVKIQISYFKFNGNLAISSPAGS
jgi:hypothetical protein